MSKLSRYLVFCVITTFSHQQLQASKALKKTGHVLGETVGRVALIPYHILGLPFSMASEIIMNKFNSLADPKPKTTPAQIQKAPVKQVPKPKASCTQNIGSKPKTTGAQTFQTTESVDIPKVVKEAVAAIPKNTTHPVYINLNLNNQQAAASAHNDTSGHDVSGRPSTPKGASQGVPPGKISWYTATKEQMSLCLFRVTTWIRAHKIKTSFLCGLGIYSGLHLYVWSLAQKLSDPQCWSYWKRLLSLNDLYQTKQDELITSIMTTLQNTYHDTNQLTNAERFIKDAANELSLLKSYKNTLNSLNMWYLRKLFFVNRSPLGTIPERIARLEFLKNTVTGWLKEYKSTHNYNNLFSTST